jgi:hypothetical protein
VIPIGHADLGDTAANLLASPWMPEAHLGAP